MEMLYSYDKEVHHKLVVSIKDGGITAKDHSTAGERRKKGKCSYKLIKRGKDFLKKELDLDEVHISKAFRLGKGRSSALL